MEAACKAAILAIFQIRSAEDHVHILVRLTRTIALVHMLGLSAFARQRGYVALSIGAVDQERTIRSIQAQEDQNGKASFQQELQAPLAQAKLA